MTDICHNKEYAWLFRDRGSGKDSGFVKAKEFFGSGLTVALYGLSIFGLTGLWGVIVKEFFESDYKKGARLCGIRLPGCFGRRWWFKKDRSSFGLERVSYVVCYLSILVLMCPPIVMGIAYIKDGDVADMEAVVVFDKQCRVAHVTMSAWKSYLDVSIYSRVMRVVKWFLNA